MDWHALLGVASAAVGLAALVPYIRDMVRGNTKPNIVSWFLWALTVGISAAAQFSAEPSWSGALVVVTFFGDVSVLILALVAYGYTKYYWWDGVCLMLALVAVALWVVSGNPLVALGFALLADGIGYIPTYVKSYRDPYSETPSAWFIFGISGLLAAGAATSFDFASLGFPLYYLVLNAGLTGLIVVRQRLKNP